MGVARFYRWLSERFPLINDVVDIESVPDVDNFYLDMNGVVHTCSHGPATKSHSTADIARDTFAYVVEMVSRVKPRRLLYLAIDGVAPRAKINQQRSRRFRAAHANRCAAENRSKYGQMAGSEESKEHFDSNCITPGTEFMHELNEYLLKCIAERIVSDPLWSGITVVFSGPDTPGEGEHKIMDYIRYMKSRDDYDRHVRHMLYGLDADLIMLALSTHALHFTLLREEVVFGAGPGHQKKAHEASRELVHKGKFQLLSVSLLRQYLQMELCVHPSISGEAVIDDFVLFCFLIGNDFLPHIPLLEVGNGGLNVLLSSYKQWLNEQVQRGARGKDLALSSGGQVNWERLLSFLLVLQRRVSVTNFSVDLNAKQSMNAGLGSYGKSGASDYENLTSTEENGSSSPSISSVERGKSSRAGPNANSAPGKSECLRGAKGVAAYYEQKLKIGHPSELAALVIAYLRGIEWVLGYYYLGVQSWSWFFPYHYAPMLNEIITTLEDSLKQDRLSGVVSSNKGSKDLASSQILTGPSPFKGSKLPLGAPFTPYQQLMAVLPVGSAVNMLPKQLYDLMLEKSSPMLANYPEDFLVDMDGVNVPWGGVAILPFIDEVHFLKHVDRAVAGLPEDLKERNKTHGFCWRFDPNDGKGKKSESSSADSDPGPGKPVKNKPPALKVEPVEDHTHISGHPVKILPTTDEKLECLDCQVPLRVSLLKKDSSQVGSCLSQKSGDSLSQRGGDCLLSASGLVLNEGSSCTIFGTSSRQPSCHLSLSRAWTEECRGSAGLVTDVSALVNELAKSEFRLSIDFPHFRRTRRLMAIYTPSGKYIVENTDRRFNRRGPPNFGGSSGGGSSGSGGITSSSSGGITSLSGQWRLLMAQQAPHVARSQYESMRFAVDEFLQSRRGLGLVKESMNNGGSAGGSGGQQDLTSLMLNMPILEFENAPIGWLNLTYPVFCRLVENDDEIVQPHGHNQAQGQGASSSCECCLRSKRDRKLWSNDRHRYIVCNEKLSPFFGLRLDHNPRVHRKRDGKFVFVGMTDLVAESDITDSLQASIQAEGVMTMFRASSMRALKTKDSKCGIWVRAEKFTELVNEKAGTATNVNNSLFLSVGDLLKITGPMWAKLPKSKHSDGLIAIGLSLHNGVLTNWLESTSQASGASSRQGLRPSRDAMDRLRVSPGYCRVSGPADQLTLEFSFHALDVVLAFVNKVGGLCATQYLVSLMDDYDTIPARSFFAQAPSVVSANPPMSSEEVDAFVAFAASELAGHVKKTPSSLVSTVGGRYACLDPGLMKRICSAIDSDRQTKPVHTSWGDKAEREASAVNPRHIQAGAFPTGKALEPGVTRVLCIPRVDESSILPCTKGTVTGLMEDLVEVLLDSEQASAVSAVGRGVAERRLVYLQKEALFVLDGTAASAPIRVPPPRPAQAPQEKVRQLVQEKPTHEKPTQRAPVTSPENAGAALLAMLRQGQTPA